jgi:DNA polymerase III subunit gamma/tau
MSYLVLARKWRPKKFDEVVGQEHVVRALQNALTQGRLHHAYLFTGTRGVGKTTLGRILAKAINCEQGISATPCCNCDACLEIDNGNFIDLIEVDAASRTKVEDTRDLLDNVQYLPVKARFKTYLIDEVHMLSSHSFNALLKTLEEPPPHVKFFLATTDPQRLPVTVLSRCLQFNLKAITPKLITKQISYILAQEQIPFELEALHKLAIAAKGSVRDALSLVDQAIAYGGGQIQNADVSAMLGTIASTHIFNILETLARKDAAKILAIIAELHELATDFNCALDELLNTFHKLTLLNTVRELDTSQWDNNAAIVKLANAFSAEQLQLYYQIGLIGKRDLFLAPSLKTGFEMVLLRMLAFSLENCTIELLSPALPTSNQQNQLDTQATAAFPSQPITSEQTTQAAVPDINILNQLKLSGPIQAIIKYCTLTAINDDHVELLLDPTQAPLLNKKLEERLASAFSNFLNKPITVKVNLGTHNMQTAANILKQELAQKQQQALQAIVNDPKLNKLIKLFDAKIINESIKHE